MSPLVLAGVLAGSVIVLTTCWRLLKKGDSWDWPSIGALALGVGAVIWSGFTDIKIKYGELEVELAAAQTHMATVAAQTEVLVTELTATRGQLMQVARRAQAPAAELADLGKPTAVDVKALVEARRALSIPRPPPTRTP